MCGVAGAGPLRQLRQALLMPRHLIAVPHVALRISEQWSCLGTPLSTQPPPPVPQPLLLEEKSMH